MVSCAATLSVPGLGDSVRKMSSGEKPEMLAREVLRWLQSLDLSYSIKNPKRDFANGFLVAEICNRYFHQDTQMHSFANGSSLPTRRGNWELLYKLFVQKQLSFHKSDFEPVMLYDKGAAVRFVTKLYCFLTGKNVSHPQGAVSSPDRRSDQIGETVARRDNKDFRQLSSYAASTAATKPKTMSSIEATISGNYNRTTPGKELRKLSNARTVTNLCAEIPLQLQQPQTTLIEAPEFQAEKTGFYYSMPR